MGLRYGGAILKSDEPRQDVLNIHQFAQIQSTHWECCVLLDGTRNSAGNYIIRASEFLRKRRGGMER